MHEMVFRSQLRGRPPEEIFNTKNCLLLCLPCHAEVHARKIDLVPVSELGANGAVDVQRRLT